MKISCSFDDGSIEDMRIADLLIKYGIYDATFYVPYYWQNYNAQEGRTALSKSQLLELSKYFAIGSHTLNHPMLTRVSKNEAKKEIEHSKLGLEAMLEKDIDKFCYPRGYANDYIRQQVGKHYRTGRNTLVGSIEESDDPLWQSTTVHVAGVRRKEYEHTTWYEEAIRLLDLAKDTLSSTYHFWGHGWEIERYGQWNDFEFLLKELSGLPS